MIRQTHNWKILFIRIISITLGISSVIGQDDPCSESGHTTLESPLRGTTNVIEDFDSALCDFSFILSGNWYRFTSNAGGRIPTQAPVLNSCGTIYPIWLNGTHPTSNAVDTIGNACIVVEETDCYPFWDDNVITIRLCTPAEGDDFYVYQLPEPFTCPISYCVESDIQCETGQIANPATNVCEELSVCPTLTVSPLITIPIEWTDATAAEMKQRFHYECHVTYDSDDGANFDIEFLFDGNSGDTSGTFPIETITLNGRNPRAVLYDYQLIGRLNKVLSCSVQGYYDQVNHDFCPIYTSNTTWVGISPQVASLPLTLNAKSNNVEMIYFVATFPIQCPSTQFGFKKSCQINIKLSNQNSEAVRCSLAISNEQYIYHPNFDSEANNKLEIRAAKDLQQKGAGFTSSIKFQTVTHHSRTQVNVGGEKKATFPIFHLSEVDPIQIIIEEDDSKFGKCTSWGDPHITTFDGRYYNTYSAGDFLLVKSSINVFEIQVRHWFCWGTISYSCNCAVAVREDNVVIGIDVCSSNPGNLVPRFIKYLGDELNPGGYVREINSEKWIIMMPSGAYIQVGNHYGWGLDLEVYIPPELKNHVEGLCGSWDDNYDNDLYLRGTDSEGDTDTWHPVNFAKSYSLANEEDFFTGPPKCKNVSPSSTFCTCTQGEKPRDRILTCDDKNAQVPLFNSQYSCDRLSRKKRSAEAFSDDMLSDEELFSENKYVQGETTSELDWDAPGPDGANRKLSEEAVTSLCETAILGSDSFDTCQSVVDTDILLQECIVDTYLLDNAEVPRGKTQNMRDTCITTLLSETVLVNETDVLDNPSLAEAFAVMDQNCPKDCNSQGDCIDGTCQCDEGYAGDACSIDISKPPQFNKLLRSFCSTTELSCTSSHLIEGSGVYRTEDLTCSISGYNILEERVASVEAYTKAEYVDATHVICPLPSQENFTIDTTQSSFPAILYQISVSTDGVVFGDPLSLIIYDGDCISCGDTTAVNENSCRIKDRCLINGLCYPAGYENPDDGMQVCIPTENKNDWTAKFDGIPIISGPRISLNIEQGIATIQLEIIQGEGTHFFINACETKRHFRCQRTNTTYVASSTFPQCPAEVASIWDLDPLPVGQEIELKAYIPKDGRAYSFVIVMYNKDARVVTLASCFHVKPPLF